MANNLTPIVYDAASREHKPANVGDHLNPAFIAVDSGTGNLLQNRPDNGLRVEAADFVSPTAGNMLTAGADGKLYVGSGTGGAGMISTESGNYIRPGRTDGLMYVGGEDILSNDTANVLHLDTSDRRRIVLTADDIKTAVGSSGGDLKPDVDQLKVDVRELRTDLNGIERQVSKNTDDIADMKADMADVSALRRDVDTNTRDIASIKVDIPVMKQDITTNKNDIATLKNDLRNITIVSSDRNNIITVGRDGGAYLNSADVTIDVNDLINTGDPLLTTRNNKLVSGLSLRYNNATGLVEIIGVHGAAIASATIPTALTMLKSINLVDNPAGQPAGTYIHFQFQLSDGSTSDMYLNVNKLAQAYSAGNGIDIDTTGKISVVHDFVEDIADDVVDTGLATNGKIKNAIDDAIDDIAIVSTDRDNVLVKGRDDGAYLDAAKIVDVISDEFNIVSKNSGNQLTKGTDGGAMLTKTAIASAVNDEIDAKNVRLVSSDADNILKAGTDGRPFLDADDVTAGVSSDLGNGLTLGTDNKPYFPLDYGTL